MTNNLGILVVLLVSAPFCCEGQASERSRFEAVSVKPADSSARLGYSHDPGRISYSKATVKTLIADAYSEFRDRISGGAGLDEAFTLTATFAPDTTEEQLRQMLQNLLVDRFGLKFHAINKMAPGYELIVAPGGTKLHSLSLQTSSNGATKSSKVPLDDQRFPLAAPDMKWQSRTDENGLIYMTFQNSTIGYLANILRLEDTKNSVPVVDKTDAAGEYNFHLQLPILSSPRAEIGEGVSSSLEVSEPDVNLEALSPALEKQLGLRLNVTKIKLAFMIVDQVLRVPIPN